MLQSEQTMASAKQESYWSMILTSLRYRNFRLVWLGSLTEHIGEFMQMAAILWLVHEMTRSPLMLAVVGSARFWPMLVGPIVGGIVADRMDRRRLVILTLLAATVVSVSLAILVVTGLIAVWHLIAANVLGGIYTSFNHPGRQAIVPNLVRKEHLLNAVALDTMSVQVSRVAAMPVAGYLIFILGVWPLFVIRAVGCLVAIFWLLLARVPPTPPTAREQSPLQNLTAGFRYLRAHPIILGLVLLYIVPWFSGMTVINFLPVFAREILDIGAVGYGWLQTAPGIGAIIAVVGLTFLTYYKRKLMLLIAASIIMSLGTIGFAGSSWVFISLALLVIKGGMETGFVTVNTTIIQGAIPDEVRGRVMSWREVVWGLGPIVTILVGVLAQNIGVAVSVALVGGVGLILSIILLIFLPKLRSVE